MSFWEKLAVTLRQIYEDLLVLPTPSLLALSVLALILAASIAFGFHP